MHIYHQLSLHKEYLNNVTNISLRDTYEEVYRCCLLCQLQNAVHKKHSNALWHHKHNPISNVSS